MEIKKFTLGPIRSNCYVVSKNQKALVIDPGFENDDVKNYLENQNLELVLIYITHGHFDHWGGLKQLKTLYPKALAMAPLKDEVWMSETKYNSIGYKAPIDYYVTEVDSLNFEGTVFNILETPGHSEGGTVLYTDGIIFSGDTLFFETVGRTDIPFSNFEDLKLSIKKMYNMFDDNDICYPGHGQHTTIGHEKKYNMFVR